jgi:branched-chain amino acid aminotransferase
MRIARDLGYEVIERKMSRGELYTADECFYTGTAAEVCPIKEVDDRSIGDGGRGPITKELQETFYATVRGELPQYEAWVEHVD